MCCVCVCVCERERERVTAQRRLCVCVCVCERGRNGHTIVASSESSLCLSRDSAVKLVLGSIFAGHSLSRVAVI